MCVLHVLTLLQECANTKALSAVEDLIGTKRERVIHITFLKEREKSALDLNRTEEIALMIRFI